MGAGGEELCTLPRKERAALSDEYDDDNNRFSLSLSRASSASSRLSSWTGDHFSRILQMHYPGRRGSKVVKKRRYLQVPLSYLGSEKFIRRVAVFPALIAINVIACVGLSERRQARFTTTTVPTIKSLIRR